MMPHGISDGPSGTNRMARGVKYQVLALGGSHNGRTAVLFETLRRRINDLGLSSVDDVELAADPDVDRIDTARSPTASVFFGDLSRPSGIDNAATTLRSRGVFVLPVVPDVTQYNSYVPTSLSGINGLAANPGDPNLESIAQRLLGAALGA